ncbi:hypothetical protein YK48G_04180 [Lentilactobacillus fungorum]|uniref:Uncharacterized protein n=1 Tax=Lentilactobacillus fungorum TaxID=2201250 RepID=A0ABQ3VVT3_9LACO|nr:hypothetical protein [Lentilactobacillus fungorum]GHP12993.1 hypothetical protein YK48G_04180 [Lentilactobacillus fungorum]
MSDRKHPHTPMKQTAYGYVCKTEQQIDKQLDKDLKQYLRKEDTVNLKKKRELLHGKHSLNTQKVKTNRKDS